MKKNYLIACTVSVLAIVLLSLSLFAVVANAQYESQQTVNVTIGSNGSTHVDQSSTGGEVSLDIAGTAGTVGSVSVATYADDPQPGASIPSSVALADFTVISFNIPASGFQGAIIVFHYNATDVEGITAPYMLYKYIPSSNSFILQNAIVDTAAQTITLSITSLNDPLFAIGGTAAARTSTSSGIPAWVWIILVVVIVAVVLVAVLMMRRRRSPFKVIE